MRRAFIASLVFILICVETSLCWAASTHTIRIENMKFTPDVLEIQKGDTVTWENHDLVPHTVTAENKKFDSKAINASAKWSHKFKAAGSFGYGCNFHPTMKAIVRVDGKKSAAQKP